ncbi:MAG: hypothetical protein J6T98_01220 [Salinivirgaceae bacterium]|nr:hypothetical protein [Salinivirgaceae bacterium]
MERADIVRRIIMTILGLRNAAKALLADWDSMSEADFSTRFNQLSEQIEAEISALPPDEYTAMEIEAWIRLLYIRLNALDTSKSTLNLNQQYISELIALLENTKVRVLEDEFDARLDCLPVGAKAPIEPNGPEMLMVEPSVIAALMSLLHSFGLIQPNMEPAVLSRHVSAITGYSAAEIERFLEIDNATGRLKATVASEDMQQIRRIVSCMLERLRHIMQYAPERPMGN